MTNPLYDALTALHRDNPAPFLLTETRTVTYRDFAAQAARVAAVFRTAGLVPGDRVVVQIGKSSATGMRRPTAPEPPARSA